MRAVPKLKALHDELGDQGLVLIGVHSSRGGDAMADFVRKAEIPYPVAIDVANGTKAAYHVDGNPDYHIIDRSGRVRVADCANSGVERVVRQLLAEPAPSMLPSVAEAAAEVARKKDKRVLVMLGSEAARERQRATWKQNREVRQLVSYEYEVVEVDPSDAKDLMTPALFGEQPVTGDSLRLVAFAADGARLGAADLRAQDDGATFLTQHKVEAKDAETLLADALARATREKKRVLVHLGAPW